MPGHCVIVPMQHEIASTMVDEDIWKEVQVSYFLFFVSFVFVAF